MNNKHPHQIKAVLFDFDGTLRIPTPSPTDAFIMQAELLGISVSPQSARQVRIWAHAYWGHDKQVKKDFDRLGESEFWVYYSTRLLEMMQAPREMLECAREISLWFREGYKPSVKVADGAVETLHALKAQGYRLALISNRSLPLYEAVSELELDGFFDLQLAAGEVGVWKPDPAIFTHALGRLGNLRPENCIYVGDNYFADAVGARAAGLQPIIFDPTQMYQQLDCEQIDHFSQLVQMMEMAG